MATINIFRAIPLSLYSGNLYREAAKNWRGRSFLYLLLLLAICWIFIAFARITNTNLLFSSMMGYITPQIPEIKIEEGIAKTATVGPVFIKYPSGVSYLAIIDTGDYAQEPYYPQTSILVTKKSIKFNIGARRTNEYFFSKEFKGVFGPTQFTQFVEKHKNTALLVMGFGLFIIGTIVTYIACIIFSLLLAVLGLIFSAILRRKLSYEAVLSITLIAITPAVILETVFSFNPACLETVFIYRYWIYLIIAIIYLFYAVAVNHAEEKIT